MPRPTFLHPPVRPSTLSPSPPRLSSRFRVPRMSHCPRPTPDSDGQPSEGGSTVAIGQKGRGDRRGISLSHTRAASAQVVGAAPLDQHRTCISGQVCELRGLQGWHLSSSDRRADGACRIVCRIHLFLT
eukprot:9509561-Alexandrium_andersonii.AAC.1